MTAMVVIGAVWLALAFGLALLLAAGIRLADARQADAADERNFAVDGDPLAAPIPAAPVFPSTGTATALLLPGVRRSTDGT